MVRGAAGGDTGVDETGAGATILVVEDQEELTALYETWLSEEHEVIVALDGESGLAAMSDDVDVVILDRRLPGISGDEVLHTIKDEYDASVVMVTAVDADTDIVDFPLDDYVTKPVTKPVLRSVVERMLRLRGALPPVRRYHSLERRRDVLRTARQRYGVTDTDAYDRLTTRLEAAARDAGPGLAWLKEEYYEID